MRLRNGLFPIRCRAGTSGMSLEGGVKVLIGGSDGSVEPRGRLVEGEGFSDRVGDDAATFLDEQDSSREVPFVLWLDGQGALDAAGSNQSQGIGDGIHGTAPSGLGKC